MKQKHLIIDIFGVLFLLNKRIILKQLGMWNLIKFYLKFRTNPLDHCFVLLDHMRTYDKNEFQNIVAYKGHYLPESLCRWQKGLMSNEQALSKVTSYLETLPQEISYDKNVIISMVRSVFSSKSLIKAIQLNTSLYKQLCQLKKQHQLYLFSNIDQETWRFLQKQYPEVIKLFDGAITSGESHLLKPDTLMFKHLLDTYQLNPTSCILIDDQKENCAMAELLSMQAILYTPGCNVAKHLKN